MTQDSKTTEQSIIQNISQIIARGQNFLARPEFPLGPMKMWVAQMRQQLIMLYGDESIAVKNWPLIEMTISKDEAKQLLAAKLLKAQKLLYELEFSATRSIAPTTGQSIFIGHGRSPIWRELKDFLHDRLKLKWGEFNRESAAGVATTERLQQLLDSSTFALLVMTAEDEHSDSTRHARANVIHEVGLFQGRLGPKRAIILLEDGCEQFSNVHGLSHIGFSTDRIDTAFEAIRRVLEREELIEI